MTSSPATATLRSRETRRHVLITWLLVGGLLVLRLPVLTGAALWFRACLYFADTCFQVGTYFLTALLIWHERDRLADYHIDRLAIAFILLLKPLQTILLINWRASGPVFPLWAIVLIWVTAMGLAVALHASRPHTARIRLADLQWLAFGFGMGVFAAFILAYPASLQVDAGRLPTGPSLTVFLFQAGLGFVYQLGYAAVSEEPLFRGFLWGCLRKAGWKELWIWIFQAGLFVLGHVYYLGTRNISFYVVVPVAALVYGFVAWRSRSIAASMAAHAAHNTLGFPLSCIFARL